MGHVRAEVRPAAAVVTRVVTGVVTARDGCQSPVDHWGEKYQQ